MKRIYIIGLVGLAVLVIGLAIADEIKFSTYYPAPFGQYREFSTTGKTTLATDEFDIETDARVGIGTTNPQRTLHIAGTDGMRLEPCALPVPATAGDIAVDSNESNTLKWHNGTDWRPFPAGVRIKAGTFASMYPSKTPVTGVGFQPDIVFITLGPSWPKVFVLKTADMLPAENAFTNADPGWTTNGIVSLDADGFTTGDDFSSFNPVGGTHYYIAIKTEE